MPLTPFTIDARPGGGNITVNGETVHGVSALRLDCADDAIPTLTLVTFAEGTVEGEGNVEYETGPFGTPADLVRQLDPAEVRERVADLARTMRDDPYAAMLEVVADMIEDRE